MNHLYIVGISHRDTLTRASGRNTAQVQSEVYRIGQWLIENENVELILPEGYFAGRVKESGKSLKRVSFDRESLEKRLSTDIYANAERLLMESHDVVIQQVEDESLYSYVVAKLCLLDKSRNAFDIMCGEKELNYLQEMRIAAILQKIPGVIDHQIRASSIRHRNAMLTVGVSHLSQIIACLKQNKLIVRSPDFTSYKDYMSDVDLLKEGFDITIIIPRTIADDKELMTLTRLTSFTRGPSAYMLKLDHNKISERQTDKTSASALPIQGL